MAITIDNYEYYLVQYLDGTLPEREAAEVEAFLESHPDLKEEMALFADSPKLESLPAGKVPQFSNPAARRTIVIGWRHYAAAACVLALFAAGLFLFPKQEEGPVVARMDTLPAVEEVETETSVSGVGIPSQRPKAAQPVLMAEALPETVEEERKEETVPSAWMESVATEEIIETTLLAENIEEEIRVDYETFKRIANYDPLAFINEQSNGDALKNDAPEVKEQKQDLYLGRLAQPFLTVAAWIGNVRNEKNEFVNQLFGNI